MNRSSRAPREFDITPPAPSLASTTTQCAPHRSLTEHTLLSSTFRAYATSLVETRSSLSQNDARGEPIASARLVLARDHQPRDLREVRPIPCRLPRSPGGTGPGPRGRSDHPP